MYGNLAPTPSSGTYYVNVATQSGADQLVISHSASTGALAVTTIGGRPTDEPKKMGRPKDGLGEFSTSVTSTLD